MLPLLQILLLFLTTYLFFIGVSNPNPTKAADYVANEGFIGFFMVAIGPRFSKLLILTSTAYQILYLFGQVFSDNPTDDLLPMTFLTMIGYTLMLIGGLGRIWCYRTLGQFFTYEITIQDSHKLVQNGPYAYIRHPSYTSISMVTVGLFLVHRRIAYFFPDKAWVQMQFGVGGFCICCLILTALIARRVRHEERELQKKFGSEWIGYSATRKRFIPGLI